MITAFTSDTHYGHANIIEYCNRPFENVQAMNAALIERYNEVVPPDGLCVWVGDCFFYNVEQARATLDQLNGFKVCVRGNHDGGVTRMYRIGFDLVLEELKIQIGDEVVRVVHNPAHSGKNEIVLHGHLHSPTPRDPQRGNRFIDIGVDAWGYRPATYDAVAKIVKRASHDG